MCSQYSAAEFPQRGDNPGTWRGSTPRGSRDRELQTHQVGKESPFVERLEDTAGVVLQLGCTGLEVLIRTRGWPGVASRWRSYSCSMLCSPSSSATSACLARSPFSLGQIAVALGAELGPLGRPP